ncbi:hypothetical protein [Nocardia amamiensis]|uniref:hypothetical protein n=1 Tax=Nocardia amamiensis TaxID=404578 RepID=UPI00082CD80A|nr:hypothetical protein [Nocardia amamiensis]
MSETGDTFDLLLWRRLENQGPDHRDTMGTLANLMRGRLRGGTAADSELADLPETVTANGVRLAGDGVDDEIDLIEAAMALHGHRAEAFGDEDPRTLVARSYLAYALAFADHLDGQLEAAAELAQDAYEGLADAAETGDVGPHDVQVANLIHQWIAERLDQDG